MRLVSGYSPTTYSYQRSLPTQPVPSLKSSLDKFLLSIKPLYGEDSEEYQQFVREAEVLIFIIIIFFFMAFVFL